MAGYNFKIIQPNKGIYIMAHLQTVFSPTKYLSHVEVMLLQIVWSELHPDTSMVPYPIKQGILF